MANEDKAKPATWASDEAADQWVLVDDKGNELMRVSKTVNHVQQEIEID